MTVTTGPRIISPKSCIPTKNERFFIADVCRVGHSGSIEVITTDNAGRLWVHFVSDAGLVDAFGMTYRQAKARLAHQKKKSKYIDAVQEASIPVRIS